jgi:TolB-like protein/Tfp pilus assembly protein PilF
VPARAAAPVVYSGTLSGFLVNSQSLPSQTARFGAFELELNTGELRKHGIKIKLPSQSAEILAALVERPGELVTREALREKLWPTDTFVDFDHGLNNAVNRLREALCDSADAPQFIETLPRRGYRFIAPLERQEARAAPPIQSIAVLPLENLTGDPAQDYFADGMTDALITRLAQIRALRVISRTSSMRYRGAGKPLSQIARELHVDAVVEGTVARSGNQVRIDAQLIRGATDEHLWAESYERDLRDVLALQSDVARAIVSEIQVQLTPREQARLASSRIVNPEAYEAFLRGRFWWNRRTEVGLQRGFEYFRRSIEKDPSHALAYAGLADCYNMLGYWGVRPPHEVFPAAEAAATTALKIDGALAEAHTALAWAKFDYDWDWAGAEREIERAIELNPGYPTAHQWYTHLLMYQGRREEALAEVRRTLELDPVSLVMNSNAAFMHLLAREYDQAIDQAQKTLELDPTFPAPRLCLGRAYEQKGMHAEAIGELTRAVADSQRSPLMLAALGRAYAAARQSGEARAVLNELQQLSERRYVSAYHLAILCDGLGEIDQGIAWLEKACEERSAWVAWIKMDSAVDRLRAHLRFDGLLRRIGLTPAA